MSTMKTFSTTNLARAYFTGLANTVISEGIEKEVLETRMNEEEYNFLEEKIQSYVKRHFDYAVVRNFTQHIPTVATVVATLLKASTKATIVTAVASTVIEAIIRIVVGWYILPVKDIVEAAEKYSEEIDDEEDLFGDLDDFDDDKEMKNDDEDDFEIEPEVEAAVDTLVEEALGTVSEEEVEEPEDKYLLHAMTDEEIKYAEEHAEEISKEIEAGIEEAAEDEDEEPINE